MIAAAIDASLTLLSSLFMSVAPGPAMAATTVDVSLWDKGAPVQMVAGEAYRPGVRIDASRMTMGVKVLPDRARAGLVTFKVTNTSTVKIHEMVVMKLDEKGDPLPYVAAEKAVDDDEPGERGELSNLDPGASGTLTVALTPGTYLLFCNEPGHYAAGMWTELAVTK